MPSIYQLKSRFQGLLRPLNHSLVRLQITANHITLLAMVASILYGLSLALFPTSSPWLWRLLPLFLLVRMALNAIDGMLAREHDQKSALGAILNEVGDVVSDAALYLPFGLVCPQPLWVVLAVMLAMLTEFVGVLGPMLGRARCYDGPMGKSDRAFLYGGYGLLISVWPSALAGGSWVFGASALLMVLTCVNRARQLLQEPSHA